MRVQDRKESTMKVFDLSTVFPKGKYKGKSLQDVFDKDPEFVEDCLLNDTNFLVGEKAIRSMRKLNPEFSFSMDALEINERKWSNYETIQDNEFEEDPFNGELDLDPGFGMENFNDDPLEDDFDDF